MKIARLEFKLSEKQGLNSDSMYSFAHINVDVQHCFNVITSYCSSLFCHQKNSVRKNTHDHFRKGINSLGYNFENAITLDPGH